MATRDLGPEEILLPVKATFIVLTLFAALLFNLLPWSGVGLWLRPDAVALVLLYWCIEQPRRVGFFAAWSLGLLVDVADGALFGQHALAYTLLAYAGIVLHRRVRMFPLGMQVLHVIPLLLLNDSIILLLRMAAGAEFPGIPYFFGAVIGGLLWAPISVLLKLPQRPKENDG
jgi:rod shape-determining protein MreD